MSPVIYLDDNRYPAPAVHPPPPEIQGLPSQAELDAYPRMFTWGELKEIVMSMELEHLMRNKEMQARYDYWSKGMKLKYHGTERYLKEARLPWPADELSSKSSGDEPSINGAGTPGRGAHASGTSTPSSVNFVNLSTDMADMKLEALEANGNDELGFLRYDETKGFEPDKYAVLPNDWPYNVPYGVRHYCVWSKIPIAHPALVDYDPDVWAAVEDQGLGGFTGVTPVIMPENSPFKPNPTGKLNKAGSLSASASGPPSGSRTPGIGIDLVAAQVSPSPGTRSPTKSMGLGRSIALEDLPLEQLLQSKIAVEKHKKHEWYPVDIRFSGAEARKWAGVEFESLGGQEVGKLVKALWDERGWECLWFVNPPRLQSVPGLAHFHVFARRKTPEEINACEEAWGKVEQK